MLKEVREEIQELSKEKNNIELEPDNPFDHKLTRKRKTTDTTDHRVWHIVDYI